MTDIEFEALLKKSLIRAAELDYLRDMPPESELAVLIDPSERFRRKMLRLVNSPRSYVKGLRTPLYMKLLRTAAAVLIVISIMFGLTMLNPDVRAKVIGFFSTWFSDRTEYGIVDGTASNMPTSVTLGYVPDGFELTSEIYNLQAVSIIYRNELNEYFYIEIAGESGKQHIDNEHSEFYNIIINSRIIDVYESNDIAYPSTLVYYDEKDHLITVISGTIAIDELICILENLKY